MASVAVALTLTLGAGGAAHAASSVSYETSTVTYNGKKFTVQWAAADLKDPYLRVMPVVAEAGIGHVESFADMMERTGAAAGVNGTFFDAYEPDETKRYPNGLMLGEGHPVRTGDNQSLAVGADKAPFVHKLKVQVSVKVKHNQAVYAFEPWGVNTYYGDETEGQVVVYTREFGDTITFTNAKKAVVENGRITALTEDEAAVPEEGYVIVVGHTPGNDTYLLPNLHVGDEVTLETAVHDTDLGTTGGIADYEAAIGVGPKLLTEGAVDVDFARDGFDDPKITQTANVRSFTGVDGEGRLVMGTVSSATVEEMAHVLAELGFVQAMNMDGGASSGLYVDGAIKRAPGRLLSNALIVKRYDRPQVQVAVNGQLIAGMRGFVTESGVTMVPFRGIFERIGAEFRWDGDARVLTAKRGAVELTLRPDAAQATVGGRSVPLDAAAVIVDGHMYIPLRFVAETLGAAVTWDQALYRASLQLK